MPNSKIKLKISLVILFWMMLIIASPIYMEKLTKNCSNKGEDFKVPTEKVIILRMDDVEINWKNSVMNLTDTVLSKNMSVTLGVVPTQIDDELKKYLIDKTKDSRVEIAQHATYHIKDEFKNLSKSEKYNIIKLGKEKIKDTLGIKTITFIPNYDLNQDDTNMLSELGFEILSTGKNEYRYDENLLIAGTTKQTSNPKDIIDSCKILLEQKNVCVVNIHPQDYINKGTNTLNNSRYDKFVELLDQLKMLNTKFVTFKDLLC